MSSVKSHQATNGSTTDLTSLQRAAITIRELKSKLDSARKAPNEPVAIVGMACRFPGAPDLEKFWELLCNGIDAVSEVPPERWDLEQWFDANPNAAGKINTRYGGFIDDVECFDAAFFGIPPREAKQMDPGQRILLQLVWNALEHASIPPHSLRGSNTGFFVGMSQNDYGSMQINGDPEEISAYSGTGNGGCFASGRISYQFGFNGPTLTSDTACSSSLVALNQALNALRTRESDLALASGVHLNLTPPMQIFFSRTQSFSPSGRCHTFDAGANGFVLGEGAGVVVLQRLSDAIRDGRNILGVIRNASVNHGGASGGLTVPNEAAQERLIRHVLKTANVDPDSIDYVETHGTGTNLGDPIEVGALRSVFGKRPADKPLLIGSVKTNIGHLNAAAGMAGLIKTVLMLKHRQIVPNLHFSKPNPEIPWEGFPAEVPTRLTTWEAKNGSPRRAGLSSFGLSGTNVHVVLEEVPGDDHSEASLAEGFQTRLYTISAHTDKALQEQAGLHLSKLSEIRTDAEMAACCYRANAGRSHLDYRAVITCRDPESLRDGLHAVATGAAHEHVLKGHIRKGSQTKLLMNFSGDPVSQLQALLPLVPFCREELKRLSGVLSTFSDMDLSAEIDKAGNKQSGNKNSQSGHFSEISRFVSYLILARLWNHWGLEPTAIQASAEGELAAAVSANALPLEAAFKALVSGETPELTRPDITLLRRDGSRLERLSMPGQADAGRANKATSKPASDVPTMIPDGYTAAVNISTGEVVKLSGKGEESVSADGALQTGDQWPVILKSLTELYILGLPVNWQAFESSRNTPSEVLKKQMWVLPELSGYPFAKDRHWLDVRDVAPQKPAPAMSGETEPGMAVQPDKGADKGRASSTAHSGAGNTNGAAQSSIENGSGPGNENGKGRGLENGTGSGNGHMAPSGKASLARIMEMQLRLTTESLRQVTNQQFDYLRKSGAVSARNDASATQSASGISTVRPDAAAARQPAADVSPFESTSDHSGTAMTANPIIAETDPVQCGNWKLLLLDGADDADLEKQKKRVIENLKRSPERVIELSRANLQSPSTDGKRLMLSWQTPEEAISLLEESTSKRVVSAGPLAERSSLIWMFPGVGDHYLNLGKGLYQNDALFRQIVDQCCSTIEPVLGTDLRSIIYPAEEPASETNGQSKGAGGQAEKPRFDLKAMLGRGAAPDPRQERMNQTRFSQPLNFIIEYALGRLWMARGVKPDAMIGYSIGEYCAAVLSGVMNLEDALMLVTKRAELIETIPPGAMLAVPLGMKEVEGYLGSELSVAISSTPGQSVVAGPVPAIEALEKQLAEKEIICRRLQSTHAFHTPMLKPLHQPLLDLTKSFTLKTPGIPFISNLTGTWIEDSEASSPEYWAMHTWQAVRFSDGMGQLLSPDFTGPDNGRLFLEVGPGVSLGSFMLQHPASAKIRRKMNLASLRTMYEKMPDEQFLLNSVGKLYLAGYQFSK